MGEAGADTGGPVRRTCMAEPFFCPRLHDVLHSDKKLTLVFEFCDQVKGGVWGTVALGRYRGPD